MSQVYSQTMKQNDLRIHGIQPRLRHAFADLAAGWAANAETNGNGTFSFSEGDEAENSIFIDPGLV